MAANSAIRKNHLEAGLRSSRNEVLTLIGAAAEDIEALNTNYAILQNLIAAAGLRVDNYGNIYQVPPAQKEEQQEGE